MNQTRVTEHSNILLETILREIGAGVVVLDEKGNCLLINNIAEQLIGNLKVGELGTWTKDCGFFEDDKLTPLAEERNPLALTMRGDHVNDQEVFVRNKHFYSGGWCSINIRPLLIEQAGVKGGILIINDITERRRLADEVVRSNRDLQQFAYVAAHDLQEPIRSIVGFGELLQQGLEEEESTNAKAKDQLRRILAAAGRMQTLIAALLSYARIETRAKPSIVCDCEKIVRDLIADKTAALKDIDAEIVVEKLPNVMADYSQLSQVFSNLIGNAIKYRSEDRKLSIKISSFSEGRFNHFIVADNGIGMEMQFADRIFIIFQRLHNKSAYEGVGIGLALCKKIIENHGGRIWVESTPGKGSEMHFTLPKVAKEVTSG